MVAQIEHDKRGLVTGVLYFPKGSDELHRQRAQNVVVAGYAVETPRLLLNSASSLFPDGLANSSGLVGKYFMVHTGEQAFAKFPQRINQYKAPPPGGAITEHFNRTIPDANFVCGYSIEVVGPHPADFAARLTAARKRWGADLRRTMDSMESCGAAQPVARMIIKAGKQDFTMGLFGNLAALSLDENRLGSAAKRDKRRWEWVCLEKWLWRKGRGSPRLPGAGESNPGLP